MNSAPISPLSASTLARLVAALALAAVAVVGIAPSPTAAQEAEVRPITLPIHPAHLDDVYWSDTFGAPRSGGRSHLGVDMMGPKMTPLVAAADGVVSWWRHDSARGNNLVITDDEGWTYHYVHINNDTPGTDDGANPLEFAFAPGIEPGVRVQAGQLVAYMGDSGNAEHTGAHLHFEIERPDGSSINPTASVDAALANLQAGLELSPSQTVFIDELYDRLVGETASNSDKLQVVDDLDDGGVAAALVPYVGAESRAASIDRLYYAVFGRVPDAGGFQFWIEQSGDGMGIAAISNHFAHSEEYQARFGADRSEALLNQLYRELFDRSPDPGGFDFWMDALANDPNVHPGTVLAYFTEGHEAKAVAGTRSEIVALTSFFYERMPTEAEIADWQALRTTVGVEHAIDQTFLTDAAVQALYGDLISG
ncbi:MAG: peptidoglycan DD-metalloendopeptidase family protein [Acidimicrobiales bacterium]